MNAGTVKKRGRKKMHPLDKAYRAWVKADEDLASIRDEMDKMMGLTDEDRKTPKGKEILDVVKRRIDINRKIDGLINEIMGTIYHGKKTPEVEALLEKKKEQRSALYDQLNNMPEIGMTQKEWDETPDDFKVKRLGRPRVSIEMRYVRAEDALKKAKADVAKEEKAANAPHKTLADLKKKIDPTDAGRPPMLEIDKLEKEVRRLTALMNACLEEAKTYSPPVSNRGRPAMHPKEKAKAYQDRIDKLNLDIEQFEANLSGIERMDQSLKRLRREVRGLKQKDASEGLSTKEAKTLGGLKEKIKNLTLYRNFCKRIEAGEPTRHPYTVSNDDILTMHEEFIKNDKTFEYLPGAIRQELLKNRREGSSLH